MARETIVGRKGWPRFLMSDLLFITFGCTKQSLQADGAMRQLNTDGSLKTLVLADRFMVAYTAISQITITHQRSCGSCLWSASLSFFRIPIRQTFLKTSWHLKCHSRGISCIESSWGECMVNCMFGTVHVLNKRFPTTTARPSARNRRTGSPTLHQSGLVIYKITQTLETSQTMEAKFFARKSCRLRCQLWFCGQKKDLRSHVTPHIFTRVRGGSESPWPNMAQQCGNSVYRSAAEYAAGMI